MALYGWDDLVDTHISARVPGPEHHFLINPYGLMFDEITAYEIIQKRLSGAAAPAAGGGGGILGQIGAIAATIFGTKRGRLSTGQVIARNVTRSVTDKVVGGVVADLGKSVGGSVGGSIGRALVRGALGGILRR